MVDKPFTKITDDAIKKKPCTVCGAVPCPVLKFCMIKISR